MDWNKLLHSRGLRTGLCIGLILAIIVGVCYPGAAPRAAQLENPLDDEISDITELYLGDHPGDADVGGGDGDEVTEPPETTEPPTEPPETTEPPTEPPETTEPPTEPPETTEPPTDPSETTEPPTEPSESEPEESTPEETEPEESLPSESDPEETEPGETEETEPNPGPSEPEETDPEETRPGKSEPVETGPGDQVPDETEPGDPGDGPGDEGQEDGNQGEEGGEESNLDLAMVMTWYKYGNQAKTIVCNPSETVTKTINTAQLQDDVLKYNFSFTGDDADAAEITAVSVAEGDGQYRSVSASGELDILIPEGSEYRNYTFRIEGYIEKRNSEGELVRQELAFAYIIRCENALDVELELNWSKADGSTSTITCAADKSVTRSVQSTDLTENVFSYTPRLTGTLAQDAELISGEYTTASGQSGVLNVDGGSLIMQAAQDSDEETYYLTFEAQVRITDDDGDTVTQTVHYSVTLNFTQALDVQLSFVWLERGTTRRTLTCQPDETVSVSVKNNQLSAGALKYEMSLTGSSAENGRILSASYESEGTGSGTLEDPASGSIALALPEGATSNTYTITVLALVNGERLTFTVKVRYSNDVSLQMQYTVQENGADVTRSVTCENGKSKTAEEIYDDQLTDGLLRYTMTLTGEDTAGISITSVRCYQSGSGRTVTLGSEDQIELLLEEGTTGENSFTVTAEDESGQSYEFTINIPYKHRGEDSVHIWTNLTDGMTVINEAKTNLSVEAWTEDESGNRVTTILATGTQTKLIVKLDGQEIGYTSASGSSQEYELYPSNPATGDTNTHTLTIYAEDQYGNYGELTLTLNGQRNQAGQKTGTASIYIDMTVLGLGVEGPVAYNVLADEPISYVVAKAVWGYDAGDPFGTAENTFGWAGGSYSGTLDTGFYLQSLSPGGSISANTLTGSSWNQYGSTEEEILQAIDNQFGRGTGLATLWRCIYRNGLNKSSGSASSIGEHDYAQGSGWLFSVSGDYFPGQSMSEYYLQDGDVLTLRFTLAYGWDVGSGTAGYGDSVGYCVTAMNGSFTINHQMEQIENEDGSLSYVCHCCGLEEECAHENMTYTDLGDGTHIQYCEDCRTMVGDPEEHTWTCEEADGAEMHTCTACGLKESHAWQEVEGSNTATCTEPGTKTVLCSVCSTTQEQDAPAKGHTLNNRWNHTAQEHYQKCSTCGEIIAESCGSHQYVYDAGDDDWYCQVCDAGHDWDYCGNAGLVIQSATCQKIVYHCDECGLDFVLEGTFEEYHNYVDGYCTHCGAEDPEHTPPETEPPETEPPETEPPETDPPETDPPETVPPEGASPGTETETIHREWLEEIR